MTDRKSIAQTLDRAAARAERINRAAATGKQCWYLAGLIAASDDSRDLDWAMQSSLILTKNEASNMIDAFLNPQFKAA